MDTFQDISNHDKAILIGLYLSKYSEKALEEFGFSTYRQAYNVLGYATHTKPTSVKLYRDEFDAVFPNGRKGWPRGLKKYYHSYLDRTAGLTFDDFSTIVKTFVANDAEISLPGNGLPRRVFSAQRLITGEAAEEYFRQEYATVDAFDGFECHDTTKAGCGFDFKLTRGNDFFCVEVKGLNEMEGSVMMTENEYATATAAGNRYCLFVVRNFKRRPCHDTYFNPVGSGQLNWSKHETIVTVTSYKTTV